jgi:hypothetical protein
MTEEDKAIISDWIRSCARGALALAMLVGYAHAQENRSTAARKKSNIVLMLSENLGYDATDARAKTKIELIVWRAPARRLRCEA